MKTRLSAIALFAGLAFGLGGPAAAAPAAMARDGAAPTAAQSLPVEQAQHRWRDRGDRWDRRWDRRGDRRGDRRWDHRRTYRPESGIYFHFGTPPVYRRYVEPRRIHRYRLSPAHVDWCYARYRSYRAADNTFQPYNGPRRQCLSPYS